MSVMADYQTVIVAAVSALSSGIGVGIAIKADIESLRLMMDKRLLRFEDKSLNS